MHGVICTAVGAGSPLLLGFDYTTQSAGIGTSPVLVLTRASVQTAEDLTNEVIVLGLSNDTAAIATTINGRTGLGHYPTRTNIQLWARGQSSSGWGGNTATRTNGQSSPDGTTNAVRWQATSAQYSTFTINAGLSTAVKTSSLWLRWGSTNALSGLRFNAGPVASDTSISAAWVKKTFTLAGTTTLTTITCDGRDASSDSPAGHTAGNRDVIADLFQLEFGAYASPYIDTTTVSVARAGQQLATPAAKVVTDGGKVSLYLEIEVPCTIANADTAQRVWSDPNDSTTFVELATSGTLTISVAGSTNTCTISGPVAGSLIKLWVKCGGGAATFVEYKVDSSAVVTPAITGSALGTIAPSGVLHVACSGTTKQFAGVLLRGGFLANNVNPSAIWTSAAGF